MDAKDAHKIYGICMYPASLFISKNFHIIKNIAIQKTIIITKPKNGDFKPKKIIDQSVFKNN